jgi:hypothetical protein
MRIRTGQEIGDLSSKQFFQAKAEKIYEILPQDDSGRVKDGVFQKLRELTEGQVSTYYLGQLRAGRIGNPKVTTLRVLADALGFPFEWWWEDHGEPPPIPGGPEALAAKLETTASKAEEEDAPLPVIVAARAIENGLAAIPAERRREAVEQVQALLRRIQEEEKNVSTNTSGSRGKAD